MLSTAAVQRAAGDPAEAAQFVARQLGLPFDQVRPLVRDGLKSGDIPALIVGFHGERAPAAPGELTDDWIGLDEHEPPSEPAPDMPALISEAAEPGAWSLTMQIVRPGIEVSFVGAERFVKELLGVSATGAAPISAPAPARRRGGRPAVHDWTGAEAQAIARVWNYGLPATKDELTRELLHWFGRQSRGIPDRRQVERNVAEWWPLLEQLAVIGEGELRPDGEG